MNHDIQLKNIVAQVQGNIVSDMDGEKVMLSVANGKYYNLGQVGGEIWDLILSPITIHEVVETLLDRYDIERDICEKQVLTFLQSLREEQLIEVRQSA